jgi:hypothetical protein
MTEHSQSVHLAERIEGRGGRSLDRDFGAMRAKAVQESGTLKATCTASTALRLTPRDDRMKSAHSNETEGYESRKRQVPWSCDCVGANECKNDSLSKA